MRWDWVQTFRIAGGTIVEMWLPAMATDVNLSIQARR